ncbi:DUF1015 family protein [Mycoplasmatota bacterium WC44]
MAIVRPFKAVRPNESKVDKVASLPYDVMNREEAEKMAEGNPLSFLHVVRSEMDVPKEVSQYDESVYLKARENLDRFQEEGTLIQDEKPMFYIYRQIMDGRAQTGFVGCTSIDDYMNDVIKKHEFTLPKKEVDRINNFNHCDANTAPIFLTYRDDAELQSILDNWTEGNKPVYDFVSEDGISHIVWVITEDSINVRVNEIFAGIDYLYIADGHHRSASSVKVGMKRREDNPNFTGDEEFNFFMSVIFPESHLYIMDYNRVVEDLNGQTKEEFLANVEKSFTVEKMDNRYHPESKYNYGLYLDGSWYKLSAKEESFDKKHPVNSLDAAIVQNNLLDPVLGIEDPRKSQRIHFVGGIRGLEELESLVDSKQYQVAIALFPVKMTDIMDVADNGEIMPAKSTWFEPKLRSGLFVHKLS